MKQILQNMRKGATSVVEVPVPQVQLKTALVRTAASLVSSGTERMLVEFAEKNLINKARSRPDLAKQVVDKIRREGVLPTIEKTLNRLDQPMVLGYSCSGTILSCGEGLKGFKPGDRVVCAGGGHAVHAEYVVIPQNLLAHLPQNVDFESGAFAALGAIALNGFHLAHLQVGETVAIIGLGLLGLITGKIAQAAGCMVFGVDLDMKRVNRARKMGIHSELNKSSETTGSSFTKNRGFDAVLICADTPSSDTVELAGQLVRNRGHVISIGSVGLNLPRKPYYDKEIFFQVSRSSGPGRYDKTYEEDGIDYPLGYVRWTEGRNLEGFLNLLAQGKITVDDLITHRFPIEQATRAYDLITGKLSEDFLGVILTYPPQKAVKPVTRVQIQNKISHSSSKDINLGVLGAGNYANAVFLPAIIHVGNTNLHTIVSASGSSAQYAAHRYQFSYAASVESEVLKNKSINVVAILTRHNQHARQVIACLQLGKHVYCEKPLALQTKEVTQIERLLAKKDHPLLMVGFNRRFSTFGQTLHQLFQERSEPLYAHYRINAGYLPTDHWLHDPKQGGGRIIGEGCHFIDFITYLVGEAPQKILTRTLPDAGKYNQDNALITLEFPDGSLGTISYLANGDNELNKEYLEVFCGGRVGIIDDFRKLITIQNGHKQTHYSHFRQDKGHRASWEAFINAIRTNGKPPIPYDQILSVTRASIAAAQAVNTGTTIDIP